MLEGLGVVVSKLVDKLIDYGSHTTMSIIDFKSTLQSLERNLKALSAKASDVEEDIKNRELSGRKKRKREVENWLKEVQIIEGEFLALEKEVEEQAFITPFFDSGRATNLNERVDRLVEQSKHFGDRVLDVDETEGEPLLVPKLTGEEFEKYLERIRKFLVTDKVQIIGICGMGGVGKTTLAKHIHNRLGEETRDCVHWITVSQVVSIHKMQDEIAKVLRSDLLDENDEDKRAAKLHQALSQRNNFVLILDDVWENTIPYPENNYPYPPELEQMFTPIITTEDNNNLCKIPDTLEIKNTLFSMNSNKSPGPDGFPPLFFKRYWDFIYVDLVKAVQSFFIFGTIPITYNHTFLTLIPKSKNANIFECFRPISLCNVVYKIITKILANRIKPLLDKCISPLQTAFVPGRLITENSIINHEIMHFLNNRM